MRVTAITVAERLVRCSTAISPKKWPTPRGHACAQLDLDFAGCDEIHRMAGSPRRTIVWPGSTCCARNSRMMSAISPH